MLINFWGHYNNLECFIDANSCIWRGWAMRSCCTAPWTIHLTARDRTWWRRIWEKECVYIYIQLGRFAVQQKLTEHCKSIIIKNKKIKSFKKSKKQNHKKRCIFFCCPEGETQWLKFLHGYKFFFPFSVNCGKRILRHMKKLILWRRFQAWLCYLLIAPLLKYNLIFKIWQFLNSKL